MSQRYLDDRAKLKTLESWFGVLAIMGWEAGGTPGGRGLPDEDMVAWCLRINRLRGVCTLQSCAGHRVGDTYSSGHLWLWLDRRTSRAFDARAHELSQARGIEKVSRTYLADGQEVAEIAFMGNERDSLAESMNTVCGFLERLSQPGC